MAKCKICGKEMLSAAGCDVAEVFVNGKKYERIRCGDEHDFDPNMKEGERCHDCGALKGHYHHWGCDAERCPACYGQLIGCDCEIFIEESDAVNTMSD